MFVRCLTVRRVSTAAAIIIAAGTIAAPLAHSQAGPRPMTFLDMRQMRSAGSPTPSPDGRWMLYTVSTPDWKEAKSQTDLYLVSMQQGVSSTRQMTFTKEKNETSPRWASDGRAFFFLSNRDAPENAASRNQLYVMRPDGGEAQRITDAREGVRDYQLSRTAAGWSTARGKEGEEQLYRLPVTGIETATAEQLTKHPTGVGTWRWAPDGKRIYFLTPDEIDKDEKDAAREEVHRQHPQHGNPIGQPVGARSRSSAAATPSKLTDGTQYAATQPLPFPTTASGWVSAASR